MSLNNYKNNPEYPDRYNRNKKWTKVLPVKGRPIQTAELIEVQSILQDNIKQGFNSLFRSGTPIKGLRVNVSSRGPNTLTVQVSKGQIYIEGIILDTAPTTLSIPSEGVYNIYIEVNESIITEQEDSSLRDPIRGAFNLGTPGASRLVWNTNINFSEESTEVPNSFSIAQVSNGVILQRDLNPFFEIQKILSKFIYERSGNFCVEGLSTNYIGISRRSVSNANKYEELQNNLTNAKNEQQSVLSNAIAAQELVNQLTQQELTAIAAFRNNETAQNQATLANISSQLLTAKNNYANLSSSLVSSQSNLQKAESSLSSAENLVTDQQIISISPGIAYVEGFRVSINSPTQLFIPQSLPTSSIDSATYTYRGVNAQSLRNFSLSTSSGVVEQGEGLYTTIEITFNNIALNPSFTPNLDTNTVNVYLEARRYNGPTLSQFLIDIVNNYNSPLENDGNFTYKLYDNQVGGNPEIEAFNTGVPIGKPEIKQLLKNYINLFTSNNNLIFEATPAVLNGEELIININSNIYRNQDTLVSPISTIKIDNPTGALNQPISTSSYQLGFRPVNKIEKLVARLKAINVPIVRGQQNNSIDTLPDDTVITIEEVTQPGTGQVFLQGSGFRLTNDGTGIKWEVPNLPNNPVPGQNYAPASGSTYFVTFIYSEPLVEKTDFILDTNTDTIQFVGRTPSPGSTFTVDYSYFLSKAGLITLDKTGKLGFILSAASKNPIAPSLPNNLLALSSFVMNLNTIEIQKLECRRQTVEDLHNLSDRINQNSKNNEAVKLDIQTLNRSIASNRNPIGIFSDSLIDLSKLNLNQTNAFVVPSVQGFTNAYNYTELPINYQTLDTNATVVKNELGKDTYAVIPYTEKVLISQPRATKTRKVTKISDTINKRARLYADIQTSFLNEGLSNLSPCDPVSRAGNAFINQSTNSEFIQDIVNNVRATFSSVAQQISSSFESGIPVTIANTQNSQDFVSKAFNDVKSKRISVRLKAEGLPKNTPGFLLYLDGAKYSDYSLLNNTPSSIGFGSNNNSLFDGITSKSDGIIELSVLLPINLPTGTHTFSLEREGKGFCKTNVYIYNNLLTHLSISPVKAWDALPLVTAASKLLPIQSRDVISQNLSTLGLDPDIAAGSLDPSINIANTVEKSFPAKSFTVNQTFTSASDYFLTGVNLKIKNQPTQNDNELLVFLGETNNELPTSQINSVATSNFYTNTVISTGSEGIYTNFKFNTPQLLNREKQYYLGLETYAPNSTVSDYEVYTAVVDDNDLNNNNIVGEQLYLEGSLFTSEDGSSFVLESKEDLTFELMRAEFNTNQVTTVNLGIYNTTSPINYFCLNTRDVIPLGTEIIYLYRIAGSTTDFIPFKPNLVQCLDTDVAGVEIKAELKSNFNTISPMMLLNGSSVSLYAIQTYSSLESKQVTFDEYYTKVYVTVEYITPGNTSFDIYYSPTRGFAWEGSEWFKLEPIDSTTEIIDQDLQLYRTTFYRNAGKDTKEPSDPIGRYYAFRDDRKFFRYKIDLNNQNTGQTPFVRHIAAEVTQ